MTQAFMDHDTDLAMGQALQYMHDGYTAEVAAERNGVRIADLRRAWSEHQRRRDRPADESPVDAPSPAATPKAEQEPWTELGYANRLVHDFGDRLRYVAAWRRWLIWDGKRWAPDGTGQAQRWMTIIARNITTEAMNVADERDRRAAVSLARRGESASAVAGALTLASTHVRIVVTPEQLDADPYLLNSTNGTLDLRTGRLRSHSAADLITKITRAGYHPGAAGPNWTRFLERVQPDAAMRAFLARLVGHMLQGKVVTHILPILHGAGANGKGTFVGAVLGALGDYADAADPSLLLARTFDAHPTGVADLFGLRVAVLHESDAGRHLAEGTVKRLTGGDRLKARRMREDFWSFEPSHSFLVLTNHRPAVSGTDEGIWRRLRLVPFDVVIPADERDPALADLLTAEADAVLAWLVDGYRDWHEHGLAEPDKVTEATKAYRADSDVLGRFLGDDGPCLRGPHFTAYSADLYAAWAKWCADQGETPGTVTAFSLALKDDHGFDGHKSHGRWVWHCIGVPGVTVPSREQS